MSIISAISRNDACRSRVKCLAGVTLEDARADFPSERGRVLIFHCCRQRVSVGGWVGDGWHYSRTLLLAGGPARAVARLSAALISVLGGMLIVGLASAHGGGTTQLSGVAAGPFWLTVWTSPDTVRVGELHVTVGIGGVDGAPNVPVLDAVVEVEIAAQSEEGVSLSSVATTEQSSNKFLYEVDFVLPESGLYLVTVKVSGADGQGSGSFDLEVLPAETSDWLGLMVVGGSLAALAAWMVLRKRANVLV